MIPFTRNVKKKKEENLKNSHTHTPKKSSQTSKEEKKAKLERLMAPRDRDRNEIDYK